MLRIATRLTCSMAVSAYTHKCGIILAHRLVALAAKLFGLPVTAVTTNRVGRGGTGCPWPSWILKFDIFLLYF